jgi:hypothetical protein
LPIYPLDSSASHTSSPHPPLKVNPSRLFFSAVFHGAHFTIRADLPPSSEPLEHLNPFSLTHSTKPYHFSCIKSCLWKNTHFSLSC